ncbi:HAMP domain-containing protein [Geodermatophilus sp. SYSU D01176]
MFLVVAALLVGLLATLLAGRSVGAPLHDLRRAVQRVGRGDHDVRVPVDDAGEIGLLQAGLNSMVAGLAERERLRDLFGRHVGTTVAQRALVTAVSSRRPPRPGGASARRRARPRAPACR